MAVETLVIQQQNCSPSQSVPSPKRDNQVYSSSSGNKSSSSWTVCKVLNVKVDDNKTQRKRDNRFIFSSE